MSGFAMPVPLPVHEQPPPCVGTDAEVWFSLSVLDIAECLTACAVCPVREACLAGALERGEEYGIWGGRLLLPQVKLNSNRSARERRRIRENKSPVWRTMHDAGPDPRSEAALSSVSATIGSLTMQSMSVSEPVVA